MSRLGRLAAMVLAGWVLLAVFWGTTVSPATAQTRAPIASSGTDSARSILERARASVIQVNGFVSTNSAPTFHGTGFAASPGGYFVTNYHVVAEHVLEPSKYRLEYKTPDGKTGALKILAIDVGHDLAIAFAADYAPEPLTFADGKPGRGERAYAIGFPLDVGLTITEGVSNGQVDGHFVPRIHYSGALNGGMSGGPTMNSAGEVLGVNVSHYRFQQSISFLVPAHFARNLVIASVDGKADGKSLDTFVSAQAKVHGMSLLAGFGATVPTEVTLGYTLPAKLAPFVDCTANATPSANAPVQAVRITCTAKAQIYLSQSLVTGNLAYAHTVLTSARLDPWRFAYRMSSGGGHGHAASGFMGPGFMGPGFMGPGFMGPGFMGPGNRRHVGPVACEIKVVALKGFDADVSVCTRAYRKLAGLYDFSVRITSVSGTSHGVVSSLDMNGMDFEAGMSFIRRFVDAMERKS